MHMYRCLAGLEHQARHLGYALISTNLLQAVNCSNLHLFEIYIHHAMLYTPFCIESILLNLGGNLADRRLFASAVTAAPSSFFRLPRMNRPL